MYRTHCACLNPALYNSCHTFFRALTWSADGRKLVPPNALEKNLTLTRARQYYMQAVIVPHLLTPYNNANGKQEWERRLETLMKNLQFGGEELVGGSFGANTFSSQLRVHQ